MPKVAVGLSEDPQLLTRIYGEYVQHPHLALNLKRACRLWEIDERRCAIALGELVDLGCLRLCGGEYLLADMALLSA